MPSVGRVVGVTFVISVLLAFFVWVLIEMAWASSAYFRLDKLALGFAIALVGGGLVYLLTAPLGRPRRSRRR